ncbi:M23 family metallopeptidase [Kiloniella laminariae]|uniref:M23 family metallopeptidase n=1 Tax=Kiloniella laminariae TaxID=454162 RepID=A0ABT4LK41_9PROT|nr:M23 family metallopeptidase [Kiloniella laminariae]MCZ4280362.1 M23 family metallopeptidase [Kiloniella laminariae]
MGNRKPDRLRLVSAFLAGLSSFYSGAINAEEPVPLAPLISFPVVCDTSKDCFIQHYFDYDPGPEALDHTCGILTYNGHQGIDIRVSSPEWMGKGFPVIAAAKGRVELIKDGVPDRAFSQDEIRSSRGLAPKPNNTVIINHGDGWRTHYGHMRQGSVIVKAGQEVSQGALLGLVGLSGSTSFPHLHFHLSHKGKIIDPFTGLTGSEGCEAAAEGRSYWSADANAKLGYKNGGIFKTGFSDHSPNIEELESKDIEINQYPPGTNEFYFWVNLWGIRKGDLEEFRVRLPDGDTYLRNDSIKSNVVLGLRSFYYSRNIPLPTGTYHINYKLRRPGKQETPDVIINIDDTMEILPQPSIFTRPPDE